MDVLIIAASPRQNSLTLRFARHLERILVAKSSVNSVEIIDFEDFDFPSIGKGNFGLDGFSTFQSKLIHAWKAADLIFICSPEYNWTANAELFILFDRLGNTAFRNHFENKTFASIGVSSGRGGRQPALDINKVLSKVISFLGTFSVVSPKILEVHEAGRNVSEEFETFGNPVFDNSVLEFVNYSLEFGRRWTRVNSA